MVDYSKFSDAEIAQKVFFWVSDNICPKGGFAHFFNGAFFYSEGKSSAKTFDPCNNPADAWPIIIENGITLAFQGVNWWADNLAYWVDGVEWNIGGVIDKNPLRAAMIVFLMMQDAKNG